jgi:hypothetical protein
MNDVLAAVAQGLADRIASRVKARDRVEALDESGQGPTYRERLDGDLAAVEALAIAAVEDLFRVVGDSDARQTLRAMDEEAPSTPAPALMMAGLVVTSWDGRAVRLSELGSAALGLVDSLTGEIVERVRERLGPSDGG